METTIELPEVIKKPKDKAIHFAGLNAFRFLAASLVVLVHVEEIRKVLGVTRFSLGVSGTMGGLSVTFFFVLSGFLITFLLLKEKDSFSTIEVKKFYWRRVLRIWPLYYLIIFIAFAIINNYTLFPELADKSVYEKAPANILLYITLLPNVAWINGLQIIYANQLWSVGVEEQFYLVWPLIVKKLTPVKILYFMIGLVGFFVLVRNAAAFLENHPLLPVSHEVLGFINSYLTVTRISCMAIGGIGAYFYFYKPSIIDTLISSTIVDVVVISLVICLGIKNIYIPYVMHEAYSILFCYIILSASCKSSSILRFENSMWRWLGNLSYGIYMWHMVVLSIVLLGIKRWAIHDSFQLDILLYAGVLLLTIVVSWLSYNYIEKPFLRMKKRFVVVKSKA
jgi:peptidoglycan/LPS O-acetylase OafA/YrhL